MEDLSLFLTLVLLELDCLHPLRADAVVDGRHLLHGGEGEPARPAARREWI